MIRHLQREIPPPPEPTGLDEQGLQSLQAARRALPVQRLVGNGMDYADAVALHEAAERGVPWTDAACWAGDANLQRAWAALAAVTRRDHLFRAAACFRFAQSVLMRDTADKVSIYRRALEAFSAAAALAQPAYDKVEIAWGDGCLTGWLIRPPGVPAPPAVITFGGADGWREEYHDGALALRERGVATLLLDGPGQGETRILGKVYFPWRGEPTGIGGAFSAAVTALLADSRLGGKVGIWGNSLGGTFAALTASSDHRIAACCVTGGSADPAKMLARFPRLAERLGAMTGTIEPGIATAMLEGLALPPTANRISCPLLVLHGGADPLFTVDEAVALAEGARSTDVEILLWDDGDHCLYNHTREKHALLADWFAARLTPGDAASA